MKTGDHYERAKDRIPIGPAHEDRQFMRAALREAARAREEGEVPVGAVVVRERRIIARGRNTVERCGDATLHAEMVALRDAYGVTGDWRLAGCTLYVTLEPCPMCAGAMLLSRIARVAFGACDRRAGAAGSVVNVLEGRRFGHHVEVTGGILEEEARRLLRGFFSDVR